MEPHVPPAPDFTTAPPPPLSDRARIRAAYRDHLLRHGAPPPTVFALAETVGLSESVFYEHYPTFEAVDRDIFREFIEQARRRAEATPEYAAYAVREKLLAFYYTLIEGLRAERSYVQLKQRQRPFFNRSTPTYLQDAKSSFEQYADELLIEARMSKEVARRAFFNDRYAAGFWYQLLFLLDFWLKDSSPSFERTDEAIEKAVTLSFDLIGRNPLDSAVEFAKFLWRR
ncbi:MAG: TetR/AcrR family transcriptional regulator [Hymenobacteraceae bacterium]|nr:TetR/AcrR family transcriptional regulator [Hymenobacteraceae bacterium]